jgi:hypothetical protein
MSNVGLSRGSLLPTAYAVQTPVAAKDLPRTISRLAVGTVIQGTVVGRDSRGQTELQTVHGSLRLNTRLSLPQGSRVTLQLQSMGNQMQLVILAVNEQPVGGASPQGRAAPAASPPANATPAGTTPTPSSTASATAPQAAAVSASATPGRATPGGAASTGAIPGGATTPGTGAATTPGATPPELPALRAGAFVVATVLERPTDASSAPARPALAGSTPAPLPPTPPLATGPLQNHSESASRFGPDRLDAAGNAAFRTAMADRPPPPGAHLHFRVLSVTPAPLGGQGTPLPASAAPAAGPDAAVVTATALGTNLSNQLVVKTSLGTLVLTTRAQLAPGSQLVLELVDRPAAGAEPRPTGAPESSTRIPVAEWTTLHKTVEALARIDAGAASRLIETTIPTPGPRLAANLLFLIAALRVGDIRGWLGDRTLHRLQRAGHGDLVSRLGDEVTRAGHLITDSPTGEWRSHPLPLFNGGEWHGLWLHLRNRDAEAEEGEETAGGSRFVLDFDLSRLGTMQLDGLVHLKRFDLIVRTHEALPPEIRRDISGIFTDTLKQIGYAGVIGFQTAPEFTLASPEEKSDHGVGLMV